MGRTGERLIAAAKEAVEVAAGLRPAARITINGRAYVPDPGFDVEFVVEALSIIEDGEGDAQEIARQTLIAIGRDPEEPH